MVYNKILDFSQLFLDQLIDCITENKKPTYVPYARWLRLILARDEGYIDIHGIIIPIPVLSSKIINAAFIDGEKNIIQRMGNWIANLYTVESSNSEEEDNEVDEHENGDDEEGVMKKKTLMLKKMSLSLI